MKLMIILLLALSPVAAATAQTGDRDLDLRFGMGMSHIKKWNKSFFLSEYELNAMITDHFTVAPSIILLPPDSRSDSFLPGFFQANLNAFVSPFGNNRRNDFRMGGGPSFYKLGNDYLPAIRSSFGVSLIIEDSHMISDRFFIGVKAFIQPYLDKEINSGVLLKAGIKL